MIQQSMSVNLTQVDTTPTAQIGQLWMDANTNNEYIYLPGVASTAANDACTYIRTAGSATTRPTYTTTRLTDSSAAGRVVIAQAAIVASSYGWYLHTGAATVKSSSATAGGLVCASSTAGTITSTVANNALIVGAVSVTATSSGTSTLMLMAGAYWSGELGTA